MTKAFTIGSDPEVFIFDTKEKRFVSAHDIVPGTKKKPYPLKHCSIQADGTAVEFNTIPVAWRPSVDSTNVLITRFSQAVKDAFNECNDLVKSVNSNFELKAVSAVLYPEDYFKSLPNSAKELGCDPDFEARSGKINLVPDLTKTEYKTLRTGGGHIHIGWTDFVKNIDVEDEAHINDCRVMSNVLMKNYNEFSSFYNRGIKEDKLRTKLYGSGSVFRPKPFGVEFRTPSNSWLPKVQTLGNYIYDALGCFRRMSENNYKIYLGGEYR